MIDAAIGGVERAGAIGRVKDRLHLQVGGAVAEPAEHKGQLFGQPVARLVAGPGGAVLLEQGRDELAARAGDPGEAGDL